MASSAQLRNKEPLDMDAIFATFEEEGKKPLGPDWRTPNDFYILEAAQFCRPGQESSADPKKSDKLPEDWPGVDIDPALALQILKLDFDGQFHAYKNWLYPSKHSIRPPESTCPGMTEAGKMLAEAIQNGDKIAVYCDYDVDGTASGEIFRLGTAPYTSEGQLFYGYADAQQGFGLTNDFVEQAHQAGAKVLVTLDCGTGQASQVRLAQSLGMKVIVVDHHNIGENPAEFHLNPKLGANGLGAQQPEIPTSDNTGAQLSWKLTAAVQQAMEGKTRPEHWQEAMNLAGMGCLADMGSVLLHENRAFFWCAADSYVPGVQALAEKLGEDLEYVGSAISTQAALNLPKRTAKVSAQDIGLLLAAKSTEEAMPYVDKLIACYEEAKPVRKRMIAQALEQTGQAKMEGERIIRPKQAEKNDYFAVAVLEEEFSDYAGYTGPVAQSVSKTAGKPAVVFAPRGVDEWGQEIYKFSSRNGCNAGIELGKLIDDPEMRAACRLKKKDEAGQVVEEPVVGGHAEVVSGACTKENLPRVVQAMRSYAAQVYREGTSFWPSPWTGPEAFLVERKIPASRFEALEAQTKHLGPFTGQKQALYPSTRPDKADVKASNTELRVSVEGTLRDLKTNPELNGWLEGVLDLGDGVTRAVCYPEDADERPEGKKCEWVLRLGKPGRYYLRLFYDPTAEKA